VDARENQPAALELRLQAFTNLQITWRELCRQSFTSDVHVRARLVGSRNAIYRADHLAVDQDDPLVAGAYLRPILLHHERFAENCLEQLNQRVEVRVSRRDTEHRGAAVAIEWFDDDVLVTLAEALHVLRIARDEGGRHQV